MKRDKYLQPSIQVVKVTPHTMMAVSDGVTANRKGYGEANKSSWGDGSEVKAYKNPVNWEE